MKEWFIFCSVIILLDYKYITNALEIHLKLK
jgi:hypothetical protein